MYIHNRYIISPISVISKRIEYAMDFFKNHEYNTLNTDDGGIIFGIK